MLRVRTSFLASLLLTSLFVATASAQEINSGAGTTTVFTSNSEPGSREQTFTGTARWATVSQSAIEISNTGLASITVQVGALVSSSSNSGTIATRGFNGLTGVTINNSGSIINSAGGSAISATASNADGSMVPITINNTGSIIGSVITGNGNDTITNSSGVIIGDVSLNDGNNTLTSSGGAITGNISAGTGDDTLTLSSSGLITGNVDLGAGTNTATLTSSTLHGNFITGNSGGNTLSLINSVVSGTISMGSGGTDTLNISGSQTYSTRGTIDGADTINISATGLTVRHTITGGNLNASANSALNVLENVTLSGQLRSSNTVSIAAGKTLTAATSSLNGANLLVNVSSSSNFGQLILTGGGVGSTSYTINLRGAGYITSGTAMTIVDGAGASTLAADSLVNSGQIGVHSFNLGLINGGQDVQLTIRRVSTSSLVGDIGGKNAADVLEIMANGTTGELTTMQDAVTNATTAGEVADLMESLTPAIDGLGAASLGVTQATGVQVSNRLASLRTGMATGMGYTSNNVWLEGFGNRQSQDDRSTGPGFEANGYGVTLGVDSDDFMDGANIGVAFTYANSTVEGQGGNRSNADVTSMLGTLYGSTLYETGIFLNTQAALGWNEYDLTRTIGAGIGKATATTNGLQASVKGELGVDLPIGNLTLTPVLGAQATYLSVDGYTETGGGAAGLTVTTEDMATVDASAGVRAAYTVALADGSTLRPMIRASMVNRSGDKALNSTSRFRGGGAAFKTPGAETDSNAVVLGAGLLLATAGGADFTADYDAEIRSSSLNHVFRLKSRIPF